ncbi:unnamed protein product, partial [marine sediment metagenome]
TFSAPNSLKTCDSRLASTDVVELSEIGINYLMTNEKEKN